MENWKNIREFIITYFKFYFTKSRFFCMYIYYCYDLHYYSNLWSTIYDKTVPLTNYKLCTFNKTFIDVVKQTRIIFSPLKLYDRYAEQRAHQDKPTRYDLWALRKCCIMSEIKEHFHFNLNAKRNGNLHVSFHFMYSSSLHGACIKKGEENSKQELLSSYLKWERNEWDEGNIIC